jgi:hypothetical protein
MSVDPLSFLCGVTLGVIWYRCIELRKKQIEGGQ